jgi:hypothetical protein
MPVRTFDLQICKETVTGVDATGRFQSRDLVHISYVSHFKVKEGRLYLVIRILEQMKLVCLYVLKKNVHIFRIWMEKFKYFRFNQLSKEKSIEVIRCI